MRPVCSVQRSAAAAARAPASRSTSVRAGLPRGDHRHAQARCADRARSARRRCSAAAPATPCASARYCALHLARGDRAHQRRHRGSVLRARPSARGCPCRAGARCRRAAAARAPAWRASRPLSSVPLQLPGAGCTTRPGRLVDDQQVLVLVDHRERHRLGPEGAGSRRRPQLDRDPLAGAHLARRAGRRRAPSSAPGRPRSAPAGGCARTRGTSATSALVEPLAVLRRRRRRSSRVSARRSGARRSSARRRRRLARGSADIIVGPVFDRTAARCDASMPNYRLVPVAALACAARPLLLAGCASTPKDETANWSPEQHLRRSQGRADRRRLRQGRSSCSSSSKAAPPARCSRSRRSSNAPTAQYRAARRRRRCPTLDRFIKLHPASPALDYALYLQGHDQLQRQPRHASASCRARTCRSATSRPRATPSSRSSSWSTASRSRATRADARLRMNYIVNSLAAVRGARRALLLPARRLRGGRQPRAAGGARSSSDVAGARGGAVHHGRRATTRSA